VSLTTPITSECSLGALTTAHWEGQRVHRQSVALLAIEAASRLEPEVVLEMGPSIGFAQRISVSDPAKRPLSRLAGELELAMHGLVASNAPLLEEWWTVDEAREYFRRKESPAAELLDTWRDPAVALVSYGTRYALLTGPLLPDTGGLGGFHVAAGEDVLLLAYGSEAAALPLASSMFPALPMEAGESKSPRSTSVVEESEIAYVERHARRASTHVANVMLGQERWLEALGITSVGALNHACVSGEISQLIRVSEGFHEKRIGAIADEVRDRRKDLRVICIAGPSSSGKTTFIQRLEVQLQVNGIKPIRLSLDDYYLDRERAPRDATGQCDYEALGALDLHLLGEHLKALLDGHTVETARFDFASGKSDPRGGKEMQLKSDQVLLLEGIHGLNPRLLETVPGERIFRIFSCPLAELPFDALTRVHASDVRLLRRIVRDRHSRGTNAAETILRWPSVRAGERRNIFPFQHHADAVFDSALAYELNVLRVYAERYLLEVPQNQPAYTTAFRHDLSRSRPTDVDLARVHRRQRVSILKDREVTSLDGTPLARKIDSAL
jgi:uridine kinase